MRRGVAEHLHQVDKHKLAADRFISSGCGLGLQVLVVLWCGVPSLSAESISIYDVCTRTDSIHTWKQSRQKYYYCVKSIYTSSSARNHGNTATATILRHPDLRCPRHPNTSAPFAAHLSINKNYRLVVDPTSEQLHGAHSLLAGPLHTAYYLLPTQYEYLSPAIDSASIMSDHGAGRIDSSGLGWRPVHRKRRLQRVSVHDLLSCWAQVGTPCLWTGRFRVLFKFFIRFFFCFLLPVERGSSTEYYMVS